MCNTLKHSQFFNGRVTRDLSNRASLWREVVARKSVSGGYAPGTTSCGRVAGRSIRNCVSDLQGRRPTEHHRFADVVRACGLTVAQDDRAVRASAPPKTVKREITVELRMLLSAGVVQQRVVYVHTVGNVFPFRSSAGDSAGLV